MHYSIQSSHSPVNYRAIDVMEKVDNKIDSLSNSLSRKLKVGSEKVKNFLYSKISPEDILTTRSDLLLDETSDNVMSYLGREKEVKRDFLESNPEYEKRKTGSRLKTVGLASLYVLGGALGAVAVADNLDGDSNSVQYVNAVSENPCLMYSDYEPNPSAHALAYYGSVDYEITTALRQLGHNVIEKYDNGTLMFGELTNHPLHRVEHAENATLVEVYADGLKFHSIEGARESILEASGLYSCIPFYMRSPFETISDDLSKVYASLPTIDNSKINFKNFHNINYTTNVDEFPKEVKILTDLNKQIHASELRIQNGDILPSINEPLLASISPPSIAVATASGIVGFLIGRKLRKKNYRASKNVG